MIFFWPVGYSNLVDKNRSNEYWFAVSALKIHPDYHPAKADAGTNFALVKTSSHMHFSDYVSETVHCNCKAVRLIIAHTRGPFFTFSKVRHISFLTEQDVVDAQVWLELGFAKGNNSGKDMKLRMEY